VILCAISVLAIPVFGRIKWIKSKLLSYVIGLFKEPIIGSLKSKMSENRYLENRHDVMSFFFCQGWSDLDKI